MTNPLLISRKENAGILRKICSEIGATPREISGDEWSLALFIKTDLKNYMYQSHYVLDVSAFLEKGDDLVALCEGIALQKDPNSIIIYADHFFPGDDFLDKLVHKGIHNIVANYPDVDEKTNITKMMEDLKECLTTGLSRQKWRKYDKSFDAFAEAREAALIAEKESEKPRYSQASLHIAVVGAQSRIGTTSFALRMAEYFRSRDGESVVVCASRRGAEQLEMMETCYEEAKVQDGIYTINGIDICSSDTDTAKVYNAEIYDFGSKKPTDFSGFDKIYVVGGTSWNELPMIYDIQNDLNMVNYTVAVNFSDETSVEKNRELLSVNLNDVICLPYAPDPFSLTAGDEEIFDKDFVEWADSPAEEADLSAEK